MGKRIVEGLFILIRSIVSFLIILAIGYSIAVVLIPLFGKFMFNLLKDLNNKTMVDMYNLWVFPTAFGVLSMTYFYTRLCKFIYKYVCKGFDYIFKKGLYKGEKE